MKLNTIITSLVITLLSILLLMECEKNKKIIKPEKNIIIETDTIFKEGKIDTVFYPKIKVVTKWLKPETVKEIKIISGDTIKTYETLFNDSVMDAKIISKVKGDLINTKFSYVKKFPKFIYKTDTLRINKKETIIKKKNELYLGSIIGGNENNFLIQPTIILRTKKNTQFSFGYELINKTYNLGFYKQVTSPFIKNKIK